MIHTRMNFFLIRAKKIRLLTLYTILSIFTYAEAYSSVPNRSFVPDSTTTRTLKKTTFSLIPSNYMIQYAGSIGLVSLGSGWDYGKNQRWSTDFLIGYVPKFDSDRAKITLTLRQTFTPWEIKLRSRNSYHPLRTGLYFNTTIGKQFWFSAPEKYPINYYTFSTKLRLNIFIGQDFSHQLSSKTSYFESVKFYYDLHTDELYLINRIQNKYLKPVDYLGLALGVKLQIRRR